MIGNQPSGYVKTDILDRFYEGSIEFHYSELMEAAVSTTKAIKQDILKSSLGEWNLVENIERAESEIVGLVKKYDGKLIFDDDLHRYVQDIKATVAVLMESM